MTGGEFSFDVRPTQSPVSAAERSALLANPGFGRVFTDHMVTIRWAEGKGWYDARVEARAPIPMDPATAWIERAPISEIDRRKIAHLNARALFSLPR